MKERTRTWAREWLKSAKKSDTFVIEGVEHSKSEVEALLGGKIDIVKEEKDYGVMGQTPDEGYTEESGDGTGESTE